MFYLIDVSGDAQLTGMYVQWYGLKNILFCVLIYLADKQNEILQYRPHTRKFVVDKKHFTHIFCFYAVFSFKYVRDTWKTSGVDWTAGWTTNQ